MHSILRQIAISLCVFGAISTVDANSDEYLQPRIVGGSSVDISTAPATAALINNRALAQTGSFFQAQFCGGTVIHSRWVLTAAHCVVTDNGNLSADNVSVLVGSTDLDNVINQPVGIRQIIAHRNFNPRNYANDIALLQLEYDSPVAAATVHNQPNVINEIAYIVGWGAINAGNNGQAQQFPTRLRGAFARIVPGTECGQTYTRYAGLVNSSNVCAGVATGGVDTCQGDSGGPLYHYNEITGALSVAGITSWGIGCGDAQTPGVYTRVAAYITWIQTNSSISIGQSAGDIPLDDQPSQIPAQTTIPTPAQPSTQNPFQLTAPATQAAANSLNFGGTGGGAAHYLLPLIAVSLWGRKRAARFRHADTFKSTPSDSIKTKNTDSPMHRVASSSRVLRLYPLALIVTILSLLAVVLWGQLGKAEETAMRHVALSQQPIGNDRDTVIAMAEHLWRERAVCTLMRIAYGKGKRSYFLETCTLANQSGAMLCEATPTWIEYRFLENRLIQVTFDYEHLESPTHYSRCINQQFAGLNRNDNDDSTLHLLVDKHYRTVLEESDSVQQIHALKSTY